MKKYTILFGLFIFGLLICSCNKDEPLVVNEFDKNAFPVNVGNWWRYKRVDMLSNTIDTILLKVVSSKQNGTTKEFSCNIVKLGQIVDTAVLSIGDKLICYKSNNSDDSSFGDFTLKLPFNQSSSWKDENFFDDSTKVISYTNNTRILEKTYNLFNLERMASGPNYHITQNISVAKNIGIVEQNLNIYSLGPSNSQSLQLIDYQLK